MSFAPGTLIGEARIVREIGAGRVATVYEVIWRGERCALKIGNGAIDSTTLPERLAQEGEALSMVEHLNVVRWLDSGVYNGRVWLVLELVDGQTLSEVRREAGGRLPVERAVALARHACEGLAAIHKKGIVHRDVNPSNVFVTRGDIAKVGDLGSAKMPKWGVKTTTAYPLTSTRYAPPEQWVVGAEPTPKGDVFGMGVTIYEMLTGVNPIASEGTDLVTLYSRVLQYEVPPLLSVVQVPTKLSEIIASATAKDPAKRCTMRELADGLEEAHDQLLSWRRSAARSIPLPNRERGLQLTVPMHARPEPPKPEQAEGPRGTIPMPAVPSHAIAPNPATAPGRVGSGAGDTQRCAPPTFEAPSVPTVQSGAGIKASIEGHDTDRTAELPPDVPATLRVLSRPAPVVPELVPPSLPARPIEPDEARRSTGIPVASAARLSAASPRRRAVHVIAGGALLIVLVVAGWWTLFEGGGRQPPRPALPPPPPPPVTATATATATTAPRPPTSASALRPPSRPPVSPRR